MLKRKAISKIIITTFSFITIFVICVIPEKLLSNDNYLDQDINIEYVTNIGTNEIYLLGPNKYLVKTNVLLNEDNINTTIREIVDYLTIKKSSKVPSGLSGVIPANTILNNIEVNDKIVTLDFSKELLDVDLELEERLIEAIVYSMINLDGIEGVSIKIDGEALTKLPKSNKTIPEVLTRDFGINKVFDISNLDNIETLKRVIYAIQAIPEVYSVKRIQTSYTPTHNKKTQTNKNKTHKKK